jgi:hypothetical protein
MARRVTSYRPLRINLHGGDECLLRDIDLAELALAFLALAFPAFLPALT